MSQAVRSRILVCDPLSEPAMDLLRDQAEIDVKTGLSNDELIEVVDGYDALVVRSATQVTGEVIEAGTGLRAIARAGIGLDNIDVEAATERGIVVLNTPGASTQAVAELTIALILDLLRHVDVADRAMKEGRWEKSRLRGRQLSEQTVGVIGYGRIGREVARLCCAFGARVVATTRSPRPLEYAERVNLDALLTESDIVTLHAAPRASGAPLLDAAAIARMKDGAYLVNASRGALVDEVALLDALNTGKLAGAGLDVFAQEPPGGSALVRHPKVICTPHIGAATVAAQRAVGLIAARGLLAVLRGERPETIVNPQAAQAK